MSWMCFSARTGETDRDRGGVCRFLGSGLRVPPALRTNLRGVFAGLNTRAATNRAELRWVHLGGTKVVPCRCNLPRLTGGRSLLNGKAGTNAC